jgi:hypothetical protein
MDNNSSPKIFPISKKWAGRVVNMQLQYMRRIKCCWEKPRMGRNKNEYKLWKNSLNEKDDGYNIGTKKNGRKQKSTWSRLICRALNVSFFILDPFGWFVTVTAIGRHNIFRRTRYEKPSILPGSRRTRSPSRFRAERIQHSRLSLIWWMAVL